MAFSPAGDLLCASGADGVLRRWDIAKRQALEVPTGHEGEITALALADDGVTLLSTGADGRLAQWNLKQRRLVNRIDAHDQRITALRVSGEEAFTAGYDGVVRRWNWRTGERLWQFKFGNRVHALALDVTRGHLYAGGAGGVRRWSVKTGEEERIFGESDGRDVNREAHEFVHFGQPVDHFFLDCSILVRFLFRNQYAKGQKTPRRRIGASWRYLWFDPSLPANAFKPYDRQSRGMTIAIACESGMRLESGR